MVAGSFIPYVTHALGPRYVGSERIFVVPEGRQFVARVSNAHWRMSLKPTFRRLHWLLCTATPSSTHLHAVCNPCRLRNASIEISFGKVELKTFSRPKSYLE